MAANALRAQGIALDGTGCMRKSNEAEVSTFTVQYCKKGNGPQPKGSAHKKPKWFDGHLKVSDKVATLLDDDRNYVDGEKSLVMGTHPKAFEAMKRQGGALRPGDEVVIGRHIVRIEVALNLHLLNLEGADVEAIPHQPPKLTVVAPDAKPTVPRRSLHTVSALVPPTATYTTLPVQPLPSTPAPNPNHTSSSPYGGSFLLRSTGDPPPSGPAVTTTNSSSQFASFVIRNSPKLPSPDVPINALVLAQSAYRSTFPQRMPVIHSRQQLLLHFQHQVTQHTVKPLGYPHETSSEDMTQTSTSTVASQSQTQRPS